MNYFILTNNSIKRLSSASIPVNEIIYEVTMKLETKPETKYRSQSPVL